MISDIGEAGLQARIDAAGARYGQRAEEMRRNQFRSARAVLRWAWFGRDQVSPEVVSLAGDTYTLEQTLMMYQGVTLRGAGLGAVVLTDEPAWRGRARHFLRGSRIGRRVAALRIMLLVVLDWARPRPGDDDWDWDDD